ncbi:MAG: fluoride efflux transporter CrcB [Anaerovoracaceae bacterium]
MLEFLAVGIGGFVGACFRYALNRLFLLTAITFPFSTLFANVLAGFLVGLIFDIDSETAAFSPRVKLFLTTGLFGGLSTFSAFSIETVNLFHEGKFLMASGNILLNLVLSLLGVFLGIFCGKILAAK